MARIAGVDLPRNKRVEIALTYIYGVGKSVSKHICKQAHISESTRTEQLTEEQMAAVRTILEGQFKVEGDLRREVSMNIKRLIEMDSYRGTRHKKGLPVRGQSTRQNARTRKGPKKTVANKKKAV